MTLTTEEYRSYLRAHIDLLWYAGMKGGILAKDTSFKEFLDLDISMKYNCRNFLLDNKNLMDDFRRTIGTGLTQGHIAVIDGLEKSISGDFVILKCLTNHAHFLCLENHNVYAVKSLSDRFDEFFESFPVAINTTILPFNGQIVYDGFITSYSVQLDQVMVSSMKVLYNQAKKNKQILRTI